jgi:hypothetical protein
MAKTTTVLKQIALQHPKETDFYRVVCDYRGRREIWDVTKFNARDTSEKEIQCYSHEITPLGLIYLPTEERLTDLRLLPMHVRDTILRQKDVYSELYKSLIGSWMVLGNSITNTERNAYLGILPIVEKSQDDQLKLIGFEDGMLRIERLERSGHYEFQDPLSGWATTKDTGLKFSHPTYFYSSQNEGNFPVDSDLGSYGDVAVFSDRGLSDSFFYWGARYARRVGLETPDKELEKITKEIQGKESKHKQALKLLEEARKTLEE